MLPVLALGVGLAACAPSEPYYATAPAPVGYAAPVAQGYATPYGSPYPAAQAQGNYGTPYAAPVPAYVGQGEGYPRDAYGRPVQQQGYAAAPAAGDSYCREAYANAAGTEQRAAVTGSYADAARANRSAGFFRRDC